MKKITFLSIILLGLMFSTSAIAQTLNQSAGWPNTAWTVTGTYNTDPSVFEADPTLVANFAFDDDDAGNASDDSIAAESPVIDLTSAFNAGEIWLIVTADYVYNHYDDNEKLALQYYDADAASWVDWQVIATVDTASAPTDNFCTGTAVNFISQALDISGFTTTQSAGFRYRLFFDDNVMGDGYVYGFCFQSPTITSSTPIPAPDCATTPFPADGAIDVAVGNLTFTWTAPATGPTPTAYNVYAYDDAAGTNPDLIGTVATTSADLVINVYNTEIFWAAIPVNINIEASGCDVWSFTTQLPPPPPANDGCSGAIALTPGLIYSDNPIDGTVLSATDDAEDVDTCGEPGPGVWYSVVVPGDGNISIEIGADAATSNTDFDSVIEVFSGVCGSLVSVDCNDDDPLIGAYSMLNLSGLAPGSTIYVRVWEYGGNASEPFSISAYSATLSIGDVENQNTFTYFPNPVKNELNLRAQNTIQNVAVYNMLGQEVLRTTPNSITSDVDMAALQSGAYFVKVTINDVIETIRVVKQ